MKQNSSILFHRMRKSLILRYFRRSIPVVVSVFLLGIANAADRAEAAAHFDAITAFKPAQRDLGAIFLQIAGSLESKGSPTPYLFHVASEQDRVVRLYAKKYHQAPQITRPEYMTDEYLNRLAGNWDLLSPKLGLDEIAKNIGRLMRQSIEEPPDSTAIASIFAACQKQAAGKELATQLAEFGLRSSASSKNQEPQAHSSPAAQIKNLADQLFSRIEKGLYPKDAEHVETVLKSVFTDVTRMAELELELGIADAVPPYSADQELALSAEERKELATLLTRDRFTRPDFDLMDRFYSGPYDKLSERGKDELSHRFWNGARGGQNPNH